MTEADDSAGELSARIGRVVRTYRTQQGLSQSELGRATGLSKTILAKIERGDGNPSIETLQRVARGLSVPLGALLAEDQAPRSRKVAARSGDALGDPSGMRAWLLHAEGRDHRSELFELDLPAGTDQRTDGHLPGAEEVVVCLAGRLRVGPVGAEVELEPGDAAWFAADGPHHYEALADGRALNLVLYAGARV